ncbi:hypothetical protein Msil_2201 [Methylocella silvestris BL2]|uniref:Helix-turn-helix domain-containing protein n=1 Tax=Methylocella silvestris (strain DSM 15510 / CIP 108128 / LMG 27833 / NCIMB 13906 / BL2) TaxID=395965 RepID=B8ESZ7_METSB|nr:helix-turn-helix domain-containing protein [Methylocella silvestris]ACK51135.1 hypothetical protein Msil_2201 [Methylocella silvestris BL2]
MPGSDDKPKKLAYSVKEAIETTGLGRNSIYKAINSGMLGSVLVGRRRIIPEAEIARLLKISK